MLILHVDNMLVAGDMSSEFGTMVVPEEGLRLWQMGAAYSEQRCDLHGGTLKRTDNMIEVSYLPYLKKICPITIPNQRSLEDKLNDFETSKCRGLLGALRWPGGQGVPPLCASASLLGGEFPRGDGTVMEALNEALRFGKEIANHPMYLQEIVSGPDLFL